MIKNLPELLRPYIGLNKSIIDTKYTNLTQPGENYGSIMLKLDLVLVNNDTKKEEKLHLVAKILPENEYYRKIFQLQQTFTNEMAVYDIIVPSLKQFQKELEVTPSLKYFAKSYGTRKNLLENSDEIDDNAVLILENLIDAGFLNIDRTIGFDFDTAKFIIKDLANFHGVFLALKLKKPKIFKNKVLPFCYNFKPPGEKFVKCIRYVFKYVIKNRESCQKHVDKVKFWGEVQKELPRELFAAVAHTDLWVNNTMQKYENGKIVANKFVDFQLMSYASIVGDLFFFLWTSVQKSVLENHLDYFLKLYYENFIEVLKTHQCDTSQFSYELFLEEIKLETKHEFTHTLQFLIFVSLAGNFDTNSITEEEMKQKVDDAPLGFKERIWFMVEECHKRGWYL